MTSVFKTVIDNSILFCDVILVWSVQLQTWTEWKLFKKTISWQQWSTHLTAGDNAVAPGVGNTLRTFFSNGIGRATHWPVFGSQLLPRWEQSQAAQGKEKKRRSIKERQNLIKHGEFLTHWFVLFIFDTMFKDPWRGDVHTLLFIL